MKRRVEARFALPYRLLRAAWHSNASEMLRSAPAYPLHRFRQSRNGGRFAFDVFSTMGLGAMLTHTVRLLKYADDHGLFPVIAFTNPLYADAQGEDWFSTHFKMTEPYRIDPLTQRGLSFLRIAHEHSAGAFAMAKRMELSEARRIFLKYVAIGQAAHNEVATLTGDLPNGMFDLSIHYRGTDKVFEATAATHDEIAARLDAVLGERRVQDVFLATDDPAFYKHLHTRFPALRFRSFLMDDAAPHPGEPRHFSSMRGSDKAMEALVNILAIARSPLCIRTCSHLSAWSAILNPEMRTISVNRLRAGIPSFPEREIAEIEAGWRA